MIKKEPTYEIVDAHSLNKFLLGSLSELKRKELQLDVAEQISKMADKVIKLNLTRLMYKNAVKSDAPIEFFETATNQILIDRAK